ncbi:hypothetical protein [Methylobacterium organophilum]|uniref:Uncharacterized protein n=1 Tax=Methylobacterium organophilum TaxID=410 RepID=A0ABQ4T5D3_METOR|nr:hypothetical protein [Methylobacterium organophilum]UMY18828.1 hypothetical protein MMB17_05820 [Methylobacterium organophilum]GJE25659.1 hypothetical protein LKMONMHP_0497 [Methylobacterium organophilum]
MRSASRFGLAIAALSAVFASQAAQAQYYDDPPPPRGYYREYRDPYDAPPPRRYAPPPRYRATGLNCDAVQNGLTGLQPFSCPLPGPRPLGARCYCETPVAPLSGPQTAVGRVVP